MISFGSVLVDGFGVAIWRIERDRREGSATLDVALLETLDAASLDALEVEGRRLLDFLEPPVGARSVRIRRLSTA
jgi:hypothetical protein